MADAPTKPTEVPSRPLETVPAELPRPIEVAPEPERREPAEPTPELEEMPEEPVFEPAEDAARPAPVAVVATPALTKDQLTKKIEDLLAEDMTDVFLAMSPEKQAEFKVKGEETAGKIRLMFEQAKVNAKKIFDLVRDWLKLIPGVNRFFLEQEAKIKTDKIVNLKP